MSTLVNRIIASSTIAVSGLLLISAEPVRSQSFAGYATPQEIMLFWPAPGDDGLSGSAAYYDIRYATEPVTESNWDEAFQVENEPIPQEGGRLESLAIYDLEEGTTYYFGIRAADESFNWSPISPNIMVTTPMDRILTVAELIMLSPDPSAKRSISKVFVWVVDQRGEPVSRALVHATWSGPRTWTASSVTDADGLAVFASPPVAAAQAFWCFAVTDIDHLTDDYQPATADLISVCDDALGAKEETRPDFDLTQNFPNPFNPTTEIGFNLPEQSFTSLKVYNILGQEISTLVEQTLPAGDYSFEWRADGLPSGVYFYRLSTREYTQTKKMVLTK